MTCVALLPLLCAGPPLDLPGLPSPVLFAGDARTAYRDPTALYFDGRFHLFFTLVEIDDAGQPWHCVATRSSADLRTWSPLVRLTVKDLAQNYCSPGSAVRDGDEWVLCCCSYPRPHGEKYGNETARLYTLRSRDLVHWSAPELLRVKGPDVPVAAMGRMIDPFIFADHDEPGKWWCFFKQHGVSLAWSRDWRLWHYVGRVDGGENACVVRDGEDYVLFHAPHNGIGVKRSRDLHTWRDEGVFTLGQSDWPWARGRLTAGFVLDLRDEPAVGRWVLFFHGSGPEDERTMFDHHASVGVAWSSDLRHWEWPGQSRTGAR